MVNHIKVIVYNCRIINRKSKDCVCRTGSWSKKHTCKHKVERTQVERLAIIHEKPLVLAVARERISGKETYAAWKWNDNGLSVNEGKAITNVY